MANRVSKETYGNRTEILKFNEFIATVVTLTDVGVTAVEGKKIVKAGTIIGGKTNPILKTAAGDVAERKNTVTKGPDAEGVLLYDVDVTDGPREGSMVISGFIDLAKVEAPVAEAVAVLPRITFMY